jgi:hypothetical protein
MKKICPIPSVWNQLNNRMCHYAKKSGLEAPPVPLVLAGWAYSSDEEKERRWQDTISWCVAHSCSNLLGEVSDGDWHTA